MDSYCLCTLKAGTNWLYYRHRFFCVHILILPLWTVLSLCELLILNETVTLTPSPMSTFWYPPLNIHFTAMD